MLPPPGTGGTWKAEIRFVSRQRRLFRFPLSAFRFF
jgi:hypothetical protein